MLRNKELYINSVVGYCKNCGRTFYIFYFKTQEPLMIRSCDCTKEPKSDTGVK